MPDLLRIARLGIRYGKTRAAEDIDITLPEGGVVALLGANGAGKSSVMKAVAGLVEPAAGQILFGGDDITRLSVRERVRRGIVYVPEGREIVTSLSVDENLTLGGFALGGRERAERRRAMLDLFPEIASRTKDPAWMLSGGEQQMLVIGRALMSSPSLLLLDEPSLGLAPLLIRRVFERLGQIAADGRLSILLVEQNFHMAARIAGTLCFMRSGRISETRDVRDLDNQNMRAAMLETYLGAQGT